MYWFTDLHSKAECQFAVYHLRLWDLQAPHMISQRKCLFCQPGVRVPQARHSPLAVWAQPKWAPGKPAGLVRRSKRSHLPESAWCGSNAKLCYFPNLSFHTGIVAEGEYLLLTQHGGVKPGCDCPESKAVARIDKIQACMLMRQWSLPVGWKSICHSVDNLFLIFQSVATLFMSPARNQSMSTFSFIHCHRRSHFLGVLCGMIYS